MDNTCTEIYEQLVWRAMPGIKAGNHTSVLSSKDQNEYDEEFEPNTQAVDPRPLAGVIAFVDVRSGKNGCENRGEAVSHELDALGATVRCVSRKSARGFSYLPNYRIRSRYLPALQRTSHTWYSRMGRPQLLKRRRSWACSLFLCYGSTRK